MGRPAGSLVLSVRNENEAEFRELTFNEQTTTPLSCTTEVHGTFYPPAGALSNGSSLSFHVVPHETLQEVAETTASVNVFKVLPGWLICPWAGKIVIVYLWWSFCAFYFYFLTLPRYG